MEIITVQSNDFEEQFIQLSNGAYLVVQYLVDESILVPLKTTDIRLEKLPQITFDFVGDSFEYNGIKIILV